MWALRGVPDNAVRPGHSGWPTGKQDQTSGSLEGTVAQERCRNPAQNPQLTLSPSLSCQGGVWFPGPAEQELWDTSQAPAATLGDGLLSMAPESPPSERRI